ncbi:MAG: heme ABC exporter ATP-binding protein CcmA [Alphaproteobacteria bacterium]|nr:heme ABC exporter ATP-binding protein CcmA [Alphaproteobacteria bacterium]
MLDVRNFTFEPLFSDLSFSLQKQETLLVRGANGAGKSTLLRMFAGLIRPKANTLFWEKKAVELSTYQQNLLYISHKLALHSEALVKDQIKLWQYHYGVRKAVIEEALELWGMLPFLNKKINYLSQGQQKRLSLSRLHWLVRSLWILDESHTNLDADGRKILDNALAHHLESDGLAILASHEKRPSTREICL